MKKHFTNIVLTIVCLIALPLTLSAADNDSDVKLSESQQKVIDSAPPERREEVRKMLVDQQKQMRQMQSGVKKLMPRIIQKLPELMDKLGDEQYGQIFLQDADSQQEFRDYIGIDKELSESIKKKQMEIMGKMGNDMMPMFKEIAEAKTDEEIDKFADKMIDRQVKMIKESAEVVNKELKPQQIEKLKELRVVTASPNDGQNFLFDFGQYEVLNLTDEQKKKIAVIKAEHFVTFNPVLKKIMEIQQRNMDRMFESDGKPNEEIQKEMKEAAEPLVKLNAATRARILALLTKEQTDKLDKIFSNAPKYLAVRVGLIKENEDKDAWKKSWKPGDPIPEGAVPENKTPRIFPIGI
ncbi:MAG: Spy/CpxP family protein refolding chaperone [Planctomycetaceae bacterium]|jgi:hypothetical protein|nr:Spy/CpxP family protein refolding chaperone [Planctomycetaceae bacterium]